MVFPQQNPSFSASKQAFEKSCLSSFSISFWLPQIEIEVNYSHIDLKNNTVWDEISLIELLWIIQIFMKNTYMILPFNASATPSHNNVIRAVDLWDKARLQSQRVFLVLTNSIKTSSNSSVHLVGPICAPPSFKGSMTDPSSRQCNFTLVKS